ncbi:hypothetical protein SAMN05421538_102372 [Paracoccus isoporae]|uniref:Uncharacterized protein n=2 Tax=Paracoccus isoporae TaxID=591205 RepID=A0A1G6XFQ2_9RHOB|nr:hypothetical protein SAMN05421538_102372 [Paracoccus isoporae]
MPRLIRLYLFSAACGIGLSVLFTALLLIFDIAHLRRLLLTAPGGGTALMMLMLFTAAPFSAVQFGIRIMALSEPGSGPPRGRRAGSPAHASRDSVSAICGASSPPCRADRGFPAKRRQKSR